MSSKIVSVLCRFAKKAVSKTAKLARALLRRGRHGEGRVVQLAADRVLVGQAQVLIVGDIDSITEHRFNELESGLRIAQVPACVLASQDKHLFLDTLFAEEAVCEQLVALTGDAFDEDLYLDVVFAQECDDERLYLELLFQQDNTSQLQITDNLCISDLIVGGEEVAARLAYASYELYLDDSQVMGQAGYMVTESCCRSTHIILFGSISKSRAISLDSIFNVPA